MDTASPDDERRQPSEDEIREYAKRLRLLPVEQLVGDVVFSLLNGAQAKLGRRDARLLIDLATISLEHARDHVSAELTRQVEDVLAQLRLAQVTAEGRSPGEVEENDLDRMPTPPSTGAGTGASTGQQKPPAPQPSPAPPQPSSAASRLWVPGR